jgi:hypothetical protein
MPNTLTTTKAIATTTASAPAVTAMMVPLRRFPRRPCLDRPVFLGGS